jgi:uncharacterized protein with PQ loop repeat
MLDFYEICGYIAGILYAGSLVPQLYKSCKTKELDDLSFGWQVIFISGSVCCLIYSIHKDLVPIYLSGSIELTIMIILTIMKLYYRPKNKPVVNAIEENIDRI